jgi:hypothetical protein
MAYKAIAYGISHLYSLGHGYRHSFEAYLFKARGVGVSTRNFKIATPAPPPKKSQNKTPQTLAKTPQTPQHENQMKEIDFAPPNPEEQAPESDIPLFDKSEPRALINIIWVDMVEIMERLEKSHPHLFELSEKKLSNLAKPESSHLMLRLRFWAEYDRAQLSGKKMQQWAVTSGVCTREMWSRNVCREPERLAFILTPPPRYITKMESLLYMGLDQIEEILALPIKNEETGKVDSRLIAEKVKIFQLLDLRVKGAVVQKIAMHSQIDQRITSANDPFANLPLNDLEALDSSIQSVKREIERMQNREMLILPTKQAEPEVIDITETDETLG